MQTNSRNAAKLKRKMVQGRVLRKGNPKRERGESPKRLERGGGDAK